MIIPDYDYLIGSQDITTTSEAERRALLMINPARGQCPFTTDTLLAAWQLLLPGERALCHQHTVFALRLLIEGTSVSLYNNLQPFYNEMLRKPHLRDTRLLEAGKCIWRKEI